MELPFTSTQMFVLTLQLSLILHSNRAKIKICKHLLPSSVSKWRAYKAKNMQFTAIMAPHSSLVCFAVLLLPYFLEKSYSAHDHTQL